MSAGPRLRQTSCIAATSDCVTAEQIVAEARLAASGLTARRCPAQRARASVEIRNAAFMASAKVVSANDGRFGMADKPTQLGLSSLIRAMSLSRSQPPNRFCPLRCPKLACAEAGASFGFIRARIECVVYRRPPNCIFVTVIYGFTRIDWRAGFE
jgi:hypothetical protein